MNRPTCTELAEIRAELALGLVSGTDRAAAVSHLATCQRCRDEVDDIARVADQLLLLAPQADPPPGFETRVLEAVAGGGAPVRLHRLRSARRRARTRPRRLTAGIAAAVAAVALVSAGLLVGIDVVGGRDGSPPAAAVHSVRTAIAVSPSGRATCRVTVTGTRPATVLVSLDAPAGATGTYPVAVQQLGGPTIELGTLQLADGHGMLARTVPVDAAALTTVVMRADDGRILYEARLSGDVAAPEAPGTGW